VDKCTSDNHVPFCIWGSSQGMRNAFWGHGSYNRLHSFRQASGILVLIQEIMLGFCYKFSPIYTCRKIILFSFPFRGFLSPSAGGVNDYSTGGPVLLALVRDKKNTVKPVYTGIARDPSTLRFRTTFYLIQSTRLHSWLRHYATSQKVADSILDGAIGVFS
jgi:hypothetical protein